MGGKLSERNEKWGATALSAAVHPNAGFGARTPVTSPYRGKQVQLDDSAESRGLLSPAASAERLMEELRIIKRRLIGTGRSESKFRGNIFMVASALPGDGKSFIAYNLAKSLSSDKDHEVVLVDGDFKKPHLSRSFGLDGQPGFLQVLAGTEHMMDVVHPTDVPGLSFIAAGTGNENANESLASKWAQGLIDEHFSASSERIVVFDSAPVLRASETQVLAQLVGQVVFVVRAGRTPKKAMTQAVQVLGGAGNCALVLNDADVVPLSRYSAGSYGYGYGYGYGNGK
jgi:protein-tyrosine kinase